MAKFNDMSKLPGLAPGTGEGVPSGGGSFLSQVNSTINNMKELIKIYQQFKGENMPSKKDNRPEPPIVTDMPAPAPAALPAPEQPIDLHGLIDKAIQAGIPADKPIGEMIQLVAPFTLNQAREFLNNA